MPFGKATLLKHQTADGLCVIRDDVPLGKQYRVDLSSICDVNLFNTDYQKPHRKTVIMVVDNDGLRLAWLPVELLRIEES